MVDEDGCIALDEGEERVFFCAVRIELLDGAFPFVHEIFCGRVVIFLKRHFEPAELDVSSCLSWYLDAAFCIVDVSKELDLLDSRIIFLYFEDVLSCEFLEILLVLLYPQLQGSIICWALCVELMEKADRVFLCIEIL